MTKLNIALFGNDSIGEEYLNMLTSMEQFEVVGYLGNLNHSILEKLNIKHFDSAEELICIADAVVVAMPASLQYEISKQTLKNLRHLYIQNPFTTNIDEAETLLSMQREADVKVQTSAGLRLNKAFSDYNPGKLKPQYIEMQHFHCDAPDVSVILDLMIEDIDILLLLTKSEVRKISANAVCIHGDTPDLVNTRIEFGNGCVANLTANRWAKKEVHYTHLFQKEISGFIDYLNNESVNSSEKALNNTFPVHTSEQHQKKKEQSNHLRESLASFYHNIQNNTVPTTSLNESYRALKLAYQIIDKIEERGIAN